MSADDPMFDGHEWPDPEDCTPEDASLDLETCPNCGSSVFEEAHQCPNCGEWLTRSAGGHNLVWTLLIIFLAIIFLAVVML